MSTELKPTRGGSIESVAEVLPDAAAATSSSPALPAVTEAHLKQERTYVDVSAEMSALDATAAWPPERRALLFMSLKTFRWHETRHQLKFISHVMSGREIVEAMSQYNFAATQAEAVALGQTLINQRHLFPMLRRLALKGFRASDELFYSLQETRTERNILERKVANCFEGYTAVNCPHDATTAEVLVLECERRVAAGPPDQQVFSSSALLRTDPPHFSMSLEDVPVPPIGSLPPDKCAWVNDWSVIAYAHEGQTDAHGWKYGIDFEKEPQSEQPAANHSVRYRRWRRLAEIAPESSATGEGNSLAPGTKVGPRGLILQSADDAAPGGGVSSETRWHHALLRDSTASTNRPRRMGLLDLHIMRGIDVLRPCDSYVVVECGGQRFKSQLVPKSANHEWNCHAQFDKLTDSSVVQISVYQSQQLQRRGIFLGRTELFLPERATEGERTLILYPSVNAADNEAAVKSRTELGSVSVAWSFTVLGVEQSARASSVSVSSDIPPRPCLLKLTIDKATDLAVRPTKQLCCWRVMSLDRKLFVKVKCRGEVSDITVCSGEVVQSRNPYWNWQAILPVNYTVPVTIEVYCRKRKSNSNEDKITTRLLEGADGDEASADGECIGRTYIAYEGDYGETTEDLRLLNPVDEGDAVGAAPTGSNNNGGVQTAGDLMSRLSNTRAEAARLPDIQELPPVQSLDAGLPPVTRLEGGRAIATVMADAMGAPIEEAAAAAPGVDAAASELNFGTLTVTWAYEMQAVKPSVNLLDKW